MASFVYRRAQEVFASLWQEASLMPIDHSMIDEAFTRRIYAIPFCVNLVIRDAYESDHIQIIAYFDFPSVATFPIQMNIGRYALVMARDISSYLGVIADEIEAYAKSHYWDRAKQHQQYLIQSGAVSPTMETGTRSLFPRSEQRITEPPPPIDDVEGTEISEEAARRVRAAGYSSAGQPLNCAPDSSRREYEYEATDFMAPGPGFTEEQVEHMRRRLRAEEPEDPVEPHYDDIEGTLITDSHGNPLNFDEIEQRLNEMGIYTNSGEEDEDS